MTLQNTNIETEIPQKNLFQCMLHFGALLGLFWMFKYLFKIGEEYWKHFIYFYFVLQIGTPLLLYFFYTKYLQYKKISSSIGKALLFCIGTGFFASLFEDVMLFAHYGFINSAVLYDTIGELDKNFNIEQLQELYPNMSTTELSSLKESLMTIFTPKYVLIIILFANSIAQTILCGLFGLVIGFFPPINILSNQKK